MYRPLSSGPIQYKSTHHPSAARPERPKNHSSGEEKDRINYWSCLSLFCAPVAQLDRALASEARGRVFESRRAHHFSPPNAFLHGCISGSNAKASSLRRELAKCKNWILCGLSDRLCVSGTTVSSRDFTL